VNLTLNRAPNGLSGYNLTVALANISIAEIISVTFPAWATLNANSSLPADSVWMKAVDLNDEITSADTNITLGTITVRGDKPGTTSITATVTKMDDDNGYPINPSTELGHLNVGMPTQPVHNLNTGEDFATIQAAIDDNDRMGIQLLLILGLIPRMWTFTSL